MNTYIQNDLPEDWFIQEPLDSEHKQYKLLAYVQRLDTNVKNGFLYQEYDTLKNSQETLKKLCKEFDKITKSKNIGDIRILNNDDIITLFEIITKSEPILKSKYYDLLNRIDFYKNNINIISKQYKDLRKVINVYIEMCNSSITEHYQINKSGKILYKGSINNSLPFETNDANFIQVKTEIAINSIGVTIPILFDLL